MSPRTFAPLLTLVAVLLAPSAHGWLTYNNFPMFPALGSGRWTPGAGAPPGVIAYDYDAFGATVAGSAATIAAAHTTWNADRGSQLAFAQTPISCPCFCALDVPPATPTCDGPEGDVRALGDGTNCVGWSGVPGVSAGALASTRVLSVAAGTLIEMDICISTGAGSFPAHDLESVMLHEFAHGFGLDHTQTTYDVPQPATNGQRPAADYDKTIMSETIGVGVIKQDPLCDGKAGANFLYSPAGVTIEARAYLLGNSGGCDFGDLAPHPSLEIDNGPRHKDSRHEWLGPMGFMSGSVTLPTPISGQAATFITKQPVVPAPANGFLAGFGGSVIAGQTGDPGAAVPASVTFETEARAAASDELDDGVSLRGPLVATTPVTIDILVTTSGLAGGRYDAVNPDRRLYVNAWEDWNSDGDFKDWAAPIAGGLVFIGGGAAPCTPPAPSDEYILLWEGSPTTDQFASPNFCGGTAAGPNARYLTFIITPPAGASGTIPERFRLDYGEDVGQNLRAFSDLSLIRDATHAVTPADRLGVLGFEHGEAKYGEVEDYGPGAALVPVATNLVLAAFALLMLLLGIRILGRVSGENAAVE